MNLFWAQSAPNSKRDCCAVYRHLKENAADWAQQLMPYMAGGGGGGRENIFVSQTSTKGPCNLCPYRPEIQWQKKEYLKKSYQKL